MIKVLFSALMGAAIFPFGLVSPALGANPAESPVKLADLPPAAQKAIQAKVGDGQLGEILRDSEDGEITYDVEMTKAGRTRGFTIDETGTLLEEEVFLSELPPAVQKAVHAHLGRGKLDEIVKITDGGEVTYEVDITRDGKERDFTLSEAGRLLDTEVFLEELSAALQAAIKQTVGTGNVGDIYETFEEGQVFYDVDITNSGRTRTVTFDTKGMVVAEEAPIALTETPSVVQKALGSQLAGGGKLLSLEKATENGEVSYDAELVNAGKRQSLTLGPDGKIVP